VVGRDPLARNGTSFVGAEAEFLHIARDEGGLGLLKTDRHLFTNWRCPRVLFPWVLFVLTSPAPRTPLVTLYLQNAPRKHVRLAFEAIRPVLLSQLLSVCTMSNVSPPRSCSAAFSNKFSYSRISSLLSTRVRPRRLLRLLQSRDCPRGRRNSLSDLWGR
jgi:hypothetical protein